MKELPPFLLVAPPRGSSMSGFPLKRIHEDRVNTGFDFDGITGEHWTNWGTRTVIT